MIEKLQNLKKREEKNNREVDDVKYFGRVTVIRQKEDENIEEEINVYAVLEGNTIKYFSDNNFLLGTETNGVGVIPSEEYLRMYEQGTPIRDIVASLKDKEIEEKENPKEDSEIISLNELEAEEKKEKYAKLLEEDKEKIKAITELQQVEEEEKDKEKIEKMRHLQEIDANTKVNAYKDMEKALGINGVEKFVIVYSEDAAQISDKGEKNSSRYSMIAIMDDGSMLNLNDRLEEVKSEGKNSTEGRIQTDANEETHIENNPASMYKIKGSSSNEAFSFENGEYGEIKAYFGNMTKAEGTKFVGTQLATNNVYPTSRDLRDTVSDREGIYHADDKYNEAKEHFEGHDEDVIPMENADGDELTKVVFENPYVPDTNITWEQFSKSVGNRDIEDLGKEFFEQYKGDNGQELVLQMQEEYNKTKEEPEQKEEEKEIEEEYGRVPWDSGRRRV